MMNINDFVSEIINGKFIKIGRAADMCWIIIENNGEEYSIDIQCPFRIIFNNNIFIAHEDMFYPINDDKEYSECKIGETIYDEKCINYEKTSGYPYVVTECTITKTNDLIIKFSSDDMVEIFVNNSVPVEQWRIFKRKSEYHFVSYPYGIDCE